MIKRKLSDPVDRLEKRVRQLECDIDQVITGKINRCEETIHDLRDDSAASHSRMLHLEQVKAWPDGLQNSVQELGYRQTDIELGLHKRLDKIEHTLMMVANHLLDSIPEESKKVSLDGVTAKSFVDLSKEQEARGYQSRKKEEAHQGDTQWSDVPYSGT